MRKTWWLCFMAAVLIGAALFIGLSGRLTHRQSVAADSVSLGLLLLDAEEGVYILAVTDGSAADEAGFMPGDRILAADGTPLQDVSAFNERLLTAPESLLLTIRRNARELLLPLRCR